MQDSDDSWKKHLNIVRDYSVGLLTCHGGILVYSLVEIRKQVDIEATYYTLSNQMTQ